MLPRSSHLTAIVANLRRLVRRGVGRLVWGCLAGIVAACAYNLLFFNSDVGALSEQSMSEEKATYGIRLFATRVIVGAVLGTIAGAVMDLRYSARMSKRERRGGPEL
jgi:hypothetical protein